MKTDEVYNTGAGKGKGSGGSGCFVCGSKWHLAADCPARTIRRQKVRASTKKSPKERARRARARVVENGGKALWSSPDGPRSWLPRYYADYDPRKMDQLRHARHGLHLGDSPQKPASTSSTKKVTIGHTEYHRLDQEPLQATHLEDEAGDILHHNKAATAVAKPSTAVDSVEGSSSSGSGNRSKNLTFFFRKRDEPEGQQAPETHLVHYGQNEDVEIYHTVSGRRRRGLIIDPGAANGLIGTETLRDLLYNVDMKSTVAPKVKWSEKKSEVTGISGTADQTLGEVCIPLPMLPGMDTASYVADVIGGEASCCPALVGNPALVRMKAVIAANWFTNGDGLLAIPQDSPSGDMDYHLLRLLLTDSKHYMLTLDEVNVASDEKDRTRTFLSAAHAKSTAMWKDVSPHTWFFSRTPEHAEQKRSYVSDQQQSPESPQTLPALPKQSPESHQTLPALPKQSHESLQTPQPPSATAIDSGGTDDTTRSCRPATSVLTDSVITDSTNEAYFIMPTLYSGDHYPEDTDDQKRKRLDAHYKAVPEEFYSKSGRRPVTPDDFGKWKSTKTSQTQVHFWEIFSGSGRFSYLTMLAGLVVAFPVDYRYGWDASNKDHQRMLLESQDAMNPDIIQFSPSCAPWSISANRLPPEEKFQRREEERTTLQFVKVMIIRQVDKGKGFTLEQPWSSAMWTESVLATLQYDLHGIRPRQRCDQCCFGAVDERHLPIQKATGFQANMSLRTVAKRCRGHATGHGELQSSYQGISRTKAAAVYPHQLCRALIKDYKRFISRGTDATNFIYYKCEKCALGRNAPPDVEHTYVPKECRHGKLFKPAAPASSTTTPSSSSASSPPVRTMVKTPLATLLEQFKENAMKRKNLEEVRLQLPEDLSLTAVDTIQLKHLLLGMVEDSVNVVSEHRRATHLLESRPRVPGCDEESV